MKKKPRDVTFPEQICLNLNKRFKPQKNLKILQENPTKQGRAEYSVIVGRNHFEKSLDYVNEWRKRDVLDLGCGYGGLIAAALDKDHATVTGMDVELNAVISAKRHISELKGDSTGIHFIIGNAHELPFSPQMFDLIYTIATMEHFENPQKVLEECYRVLREDGLVYIIFSPYYAFNGAHLFDFIHIPWCHLFFSEKTLIKVWRRLAKQNPDLASLNPVVDTNKNRLVGLNRITIRKYKQIVGKSHFKIKEYKENTFKRWYFNILYRLPWIKEMFTSEVISVLLKQENNDGP